MQKATYKIAEQIENYGFYGELTLLYNLTRTNNIELLNNEDYIEWYPGVLFGAAYFLRSCNYNGGLVLEISNIMYNDVDTDNTVIAYLTFKALIKATNLSAKKEIYLAKDLKAFVFPR